MTATLIPNHAEQALALLLQQFKGKPKIEALITAFMTQVQELEEVFFDLLLMRTLELATGVQLDVLGRLLGQTRGALDDDGYRIWLRGRILLNKSSGTTEDVINFLTAVLPGQGVDIAESFPASFTATLTEEITTVEATEAVTLLHLVKPVGVGGTLIYSTDTDAFRFATADTEEVDAARGLATDDGLTGGNWSDVADPE
jgi:hypothetical protein